MMQQTPNGLWAPPDAVRHHLETDSFGYAARDKAEEFVERQTELMKSVGPSSAPPIRSPKSRFFDPLSLMYSLGYKDRRYGVTYNVLRRVAQQNPVIAAIINTRQAQAASFAQPFRLSRTTGYIIKHKDPEHKLNKSDRKRILELEEFISKCGRDESNKHTKGSKRREGFEAFTRKYVRDSLTLDQATAEIVPDRKRRPFEFIATDAATHRIAADEAELGQNASVHAREPVGDSAINSRASSLNRLALAMAASRKKGARVAYVQVVNGQIETIYSEDELSFGIRNPRTDIYTNGYGFSELEQMITTITAHLFADEYNRRFFMQNSVPKGVLNLRGDNVTPEQMEAFKRQWTAMVAGVENSWRTPVMQADQVQWVPFMPNQKDIEYQQYIEYLIRVATAVYLIDPAEINFDSAGGGGSQQQPLFESSNEWRIKKSRDRGLRPLLRFYAQKINEDVLWHLDSRYYIDFVGLDELSQKERMEIRQQELTLFRTLNEVREAEDLPPIVNGDIPMSPAYIQYLQFKQQEEQIQEQMEMQKQQMAMQQQELGAEGGEMPPGAEGGVMPPGAEGGMPMPQEEPPGQLDPAEFQKALSWERKGKFIEIEIEDD